jgi:glycosyltransferase involved in cell wall biosynthesis
MLLTILIKKLQNNLPKRILFISHEATLTGAPILLLHLARLLQEKTDYKTDFLLKKGGVLEADFNRSGKTTVLYREADSLTMRIVRKLSRMVHRIFLRRAIRNYDLIVSNTITNGDIHDLLQGHPNICTYIHELSHTIKSSTLKKDVENVLQHTRMFFVPSQAVKEHLHQHYHINIKNIRQLPYFIPDNYSVKERSRKKMRERSGFHEEDFVVGGMGSPGWRKGTDVFLQIARKALVNNSSLKFVWCGGEPGTGSWLGMQHDITNSGLESSFTLIPAQRNSLEIMASYDLFFLSSREDPYPLVVLEAAMMGLPVICFDKSGGAVEFVQNGCGIIVDYLDVDKACEAIDTISRDSGLYYRFSTCSRKSYLKLHNQEVVLSQFLAAVRE